MWSRRFCILMMLGIDGLSFGGPVTRPVEATLDPRYVLGELLVSDDFTTPLGGRWRVELEKGGTVEVKGGALGIDVEGGATVWLVQRLSGPVMIEYEATQVKAGGKNDRVSDTNLFWMATDSRSPENLFATKRSGKFSDYNRLLCYYAGIGGNGNTTTRFRRYIGDDTERPLLAEHDLRDAKNLLEPNRTYRIRAVACDGLIQLWRDDRKLFELNDPTAYTEGWFGFRTVASLQKIQKFRVYRLIPVNRASTHDATIHAD